jgi:hypothetical protein
VLVGGNGISGPALPTMPNIANISSPVQGAGAGYGNRRHRAGGLCQRVPFTFRSLSDLAGGDAGANQTGCSAALPRAMRPASSPALWPPFPAEKTTMIEKRYLSANELLADSFRLGNIILDSDFRPTHIVGIWRGGAPVGIAVQELLEYHG